MIALPQNPLPDLLGRLLREPLVLLLLVSWVLGGLGKILQAKKKRDEVARRRREAHGDLGSQPEIEESRQPRRRTPEEVAAEMRRVLGMDPAPAARPAQPAPRQKPQPKPLVKPQQRLEFAGREAAEGDRGPQPMRVSQLGRVDIHVDPHVGENVQRRAAPTSGGVASHELGTLGGRQHRRAAATAQRARGLVDLSDLSRAFVLREILDEPRALRGWDR